MFGSDYFGKDYFGQDYFANELVSPRGRDFFGPNTTAFFDNFNRADGDPGNGWTRSSSNVQILNNELITNFSSNGEFTLIQSGLFTGASARNKYVQCDVRFLYSNPLTTVTIYWILIISYTDINNWVGIKIYNSSFGTSEIDLVSRVAGVSTVLGTYGGGAIGPLFLSSSFVTIRFSQQENLIRVYKPTDLTTVVITYTTPGLLINGNVGLLGNTDSSNYAMFDNFQADALGSPSGRHRRHHVGHGRPFENE